MFKRLILFFFLSAQVVGAFMIPPRLAAQVTLPQGSWRAFVSHRQGADVAVRGDEVFAATTAGLYYWNRAGNTRRSYTRLDGLSETNPRLIHYSAEQDLFYLAYASGRINYFRSPEHFESIPDIFIEEDVLNKAINDIFTSGLL